LTSLPRLPIAAMVVSMGLSACYSASEIRAENGVLQERLAQARKGEAMRCAPRELASAEAHLEFSQTALRNGNPTAAQKYNLLAKDEVTTVLSLAAACAPPPAPVDAGPKDRDGDGVPDDVDRCPDEPGPIENFGCPWGDRDKDGIPDNLDKCPDVPGIPELQGCPDVDSDKDGIPDRLDKCPLVPGVPPDGCPKKYALLVVTHDRIEIKQQIHFQTNKAKILPDSFELLNEVADVIKTNPHLEVRIEGHTDSTGSPKRNMKLSQDRADAVKAYLVSQGVPADHLAAAGFGPTRPIASNASQKGKSMNRRVEFRIVGQEPGTP
jgi:outer membrane protein OmpA-like peptidoglycan-associated protein